MADLYRDSITIYNSASRIYKILSAASRSNRREGGQISFIRCQCKLGIISYGILTIVFPSKNIYYNILNVEK